MSEIKSITDAARIRVCDFRIKVKYISYGWIRLMFKFNDFSIDFTADTSSSSPIAELVHATLDLENYKDSDNETQVVFEDSLEKLTFNFLWHGNYDDIHLRVTREYEETIDENDEIHPASEEEWNFIINFGCLKVEVLFLCVELLRKYGLLGVNSNMGRDSFPIDGMLRLCHNHIHLTSKEDSKYSDFYDDINLLKKLVSVVDESDDLCRRKYPIVRIP